MADGIGDWKSGACVRRIVLELEIEQRVSQVGVDLGVYLS